MKEFKKKFETEWNRLKYLRPISRKVKAKAKNNG
jgi:hypothetical protein